MPKTNVILKADFIPSVPSSLSCTHAWQPFWTFGLFYLFCVQNNQLNGHRKYCRVMHLKYPNRCPQGDAVCPASRDPTKLHVQDLKFCECFNDPIINIKETNTALSVYYWNFWGMQIPFGTFIWTLKQSLTLCHVTPHTKHDYNQTPSYSDIFLKQVWWRDTI